MRGFTLIELLVVIAVIGVLVSITLPALGKARETSRRLKCLANLKGMGVGFAVYMNDSQGVLPDVKPLHDPDPNGDTGDPSLLEVLSDYIGVPSPRKESFDSIYYIVTDPYKCPSDISSDNDETGFEPVYRTVGTSYEYFPGLFVLFSEARGVLDPVVRIKSVTQAYEQTPDWPILLDAGRWHPLRGRATENGPTAQNALLYGDWRADWSPRIEAEGLEAFMARVLRFANRP